ncbi:MarR family winged helix-turn-helix transcriptional regulator [Streptomyces palmae]|uniref:MarR family transcriptional regulator n=1 Tax=Streptomyces palmae TaxID=1701085 RepID=A0A4Z0H6Q7_9ACTN|nr:MarR family winged helix-turn-helix transcriptional regulator [Streptomyces palmae]TGB08847.1 MarR family transcriptional regulator [Streptomyces palmae]
MAAGPGEKHTAAQAASGRLVREFGQLLRATTRLEQRINAALREECGISHVMFEVLIRLCRDPAEQVSQRTLAEDLVLTSGGITRLVDRMEEAGTVRRRPSPSDRRVTLVEATPKGERTLLAAARVHAGILERYVTGPLTGEEYRGFTTALDRINTALRTGPA